MNYSLQDLLRVREIRETAAGNAVKTKKNLLDEAIKRLQQKKKDLAEFHDWRLKKEDSLYEEIKNQQITLKELDDLKLKIARLREQETELEQEILEAKKARDEAEKELIQAKNNYQLAVREKKKIEEHRKTWLEEMSLEKERAMDKEMEEFQKMKNMFHESEDDDVENT